MSDERKWLNISRYRFEKYIKETEGLRLHMYRCPTGHLTIGYGHNLETNPITPRAAQVILEDDIKGAEAPLIDIYPWVLELNDVRQEAMLDLMFNMGPGTLAQFKSFLKLAQQGDYEGAADELVDSLWYRQVGNRSKRLVRMMRTGSYDSTT